jgi:hypothetical protein
MTNSYQETVIYRKIYSYIQIRNAAKTKITSVIAKYVNAIFSIAVGLVAY